MTRPTFDRFHPNFDACNNACQFAEEGNLVEAVRWLNDTQTGLEFEENADDNSTAEEYVRDRCEEAGYEVRTEKRTLRHVYVLYKDGEPIS